jgi:hypothetical protein
MVTKDEKTGKLVLRFDHITNEGDLEFIANMLHEIILDANVETTSILTDEGSEKPLEKFTKEEIDRLNKLNETIYFFHMIVRELDFNPIVYEP